MLSGRCVKLLLLKFKNCTEDKHPRSPRNAPSRGLQSLRSRDTKDLNPENDLGINRLIGSSSGCWAMKKLFFHKTSVA